MSLENSMNKMSLQNDPYDEQAKLLLVNSYTKISHKAIDEILDYQDYNFTDAFNYLAWVEAKRPGVQGDGTGYFRRISDNVKVFINGREQKPVTITDKDLLRETQAIEELAVQGVVLMLPQKMIPSLVGRLFPKKPSVKNTSPFPKARKGHRQQRIRRLHARPGH